jgi:hypothetical protein
LAILATRLNADDRAVTVQEIIRVIANAGAHFQNGFAHEIELERGEMFLPSLIVPLVPRGSEVQVRRLDDIGSYRRAGTAQSRYPIFENIIHLETGRGIAVVAVLPGATHGSMLLGNLGKRVSKRFRLRFILSGPHPCQRAADHRGALDSDTAQNGQRHS